MNTVRRRVLRPPPFAPPAVSRRQERRAAQLAADRTALRRWMTRLKRAFGTVERLWKRIARLERELGAPT
jgi:hypothetical protein